MKLIKRILEGDIRAAARLMSMIENRAPEAISALKELYPHTGRAYVIGITGPPGSGKSTLVDQLTEAIRKRGKTVGIVAIDPTSPFTGGAILGDRIRMQRHSTDPGVFIRSMATRGHLGGLAPATNDVVDVLDAFGKEFILIETVGVGQAEVEVVKAAHTSVIVTVPGLGDEVQVFKAGILEIGDLFVVNKADREGADRTAKELEVMLSFAPPKEGWKLKVYKTVATTGQGVPELLQGILEHLDYITVQGLKDWKWRERSEHVFLGLLKERLTCRILEKASENGALQDLMGKVTRRELDPYSATDEVLRRIGLT
ncbi:MAG: methylmalonyl Co-A mutase-associated GTPase MeaB [Candidatus Methylomirabilales bacterium]